MKRLERHSSSIILRRASAAGLFLLLVTVVPAQAQTFTVIHSFTGPDGWLPVGGLTIDRDGNLYGTTSFGGNETGNCYSLGCGTVFRMSRHGSGWTFFDIYEFNGTDGDGPGARVVFGPNGTLYGTAGGGPGSDGVVFNLQPPASLCKSVSCPWSETVLFSFSGDNLLDLDGDLAFDAAGNIYGTAFYGGNYRDCESEGCGILYQLTQSNGVWTENIIHTFTGQADGEHPTAGVILDQAGNLYGPAEGDPNTGNSGLIFQFTPSGGGWTENVLYQFYGSAQGEYPAGGLIFDAAGNLIGTTLAGGSYGGGTVFQLSPSGNYWNFNTLYNFALGGGDEGPTAALIMDRAGNLYGATASDGAYGYGAVFELSPVEGGWSYRSLHDFTDGSDGGVPLNVVMDASGNLYGDTYFGGNRGCDVGDGCGVIFEITP